MAQDGSAAAGPVVIQDVPVYERAHPVALLVGRGDKVRLSSTSPTQSRCPPALPRTNCRRGPCGRPSAVQQ